MCSNGTLLASVLLALIPGGEDRPLIREVEKSYDVAGRSAEELRNSLDRGRPADEAGKRFDAHTGWYVEWKYRFEQMADCRLTRVEVTGEVTTTLPRWVNADKAEPALRQRWANYLSALSLHEAGHKDIGLRATTAISKELNALPAERTCDALKRDAETKAQSILGRFRGEDAEYDRRTEHGLTQGARFP